MLSSSRSDAARKPNRRRSKSLLFVLLSTTFISACAVQEPQVYSQNTDFRVASRWSAFEQSEPQIVDDGWLKSFKSQRLEVLVAEALANNRDLRIAAAGLVVSRAKALQAGAQLLPSLIGSVDASTGNSIRSVDPNTNTVDAGFKVSWEVDLWGGVRSNRAAAQLDAVSEELLYEYTRQSIAAQVVEDWIIINGNRQMLNIAYAEVNSRTKTLENTRVRIAEHSALAVDENQAAANLELAKNRVAAAQGFRIFPRAYPPDYRRNCWNAVRMLSQPNGASQRHSIVVAKPRLPNYQVLSFRPASWVVAIRSARRFHRIIWSGIWRAVFLRH